MSKIKSPFKNFSYHIVWDKLDTTSFFTKTEAIEFLKALCEDYENEPHLLYGKLKDSRIFCGTLGSGGGCVDNKQDMLGALLKKSKVVFKDSINTLMEENRIK